MSENKKDNSNIQDSNANNTSNQLDSELLSLKNSILKKMGRNINKVENAPDNNSDRSVPKIEQSLQKTDTKPTMNQSNEKTSQKIGDNDRNSQQNLAMKQKNIIKKSLVSNLPQDFPSQNSYPRPVMKTENVANKKQSPTMNTNENQPIRNTNNFNNSNSVQNPQIIQNTQTIQNIPNKPSTIIELNKKSTNTPNIIRLPTSNKKIISKPNNQPQIISLNPNPTPIPNRADLKSKPNEISQPINKNSSISKETNKTPVDSNKNDAIKNAEHQNNANGKKNEQQNNANGKKPIEQETEKPNKIAKDQTQNVNTSIETLAISTKESVHTQLKPNQSSLKRKPEVDVAEIIGQSPEKNKKILNEKAKSTGNSSSPKSTKSLYSEKVITNEQKEEKIHEKTNEFLINSSNVSKSFKSNENSPKEEMIKNEEEININVTNEPNEEKERKKSDDFIDNSQFINSESNANDPGKMEIENEEKNQTISFENEREKSDGITMENDIPERNFDYEKIKQKMTELSETIKKVEAKMKTEDLKILSFEYEQNTKKSHYERLANLYEFFKKY